MVYYQINLYLHQLFTENVLSKVACQFHFQVIKITPLSLLGSYQVTKRYLLPLRIKGVGKASTRQIAIAIASKRE